MSKYRITWYVNEAVSKSRLQCNTDYKVHTSLSMGTINWFRKEFLCVQFSPQAILITHCWCVQFQTTDFKHCQFSTKAFVFISHYLQLACHRSMVSLLTAHTTTGTKWEGLIVHYQGQSVPEPLVNRSLRWSIKSAFALDF